jgi:SAM-dependent methyltransferase
VDPDDGQIGPGSEPALYDRIGIGYDGTRRADPGLAGELHDHLGPAAGAVLDLACGTGNYTSALAARGRRMIGLDRSPQMLAQARLKGAEPRVLADAVRLPFAEAAFTGAICVHAVHHFPDLGTALAEVGRVLAPAARLVIFTGFPGQIRGYWLNAYFPQALERAAALVPSEDEIAQALAAAGFRAPRVLPWQVKPDLVDLFMYAGKQRPELYFEPAVRRGISTFANLADAAKVETGLARLRADLDSGRFEAVASGYDSESEGDYSFMVADKR